MNTSKASQAYGTTNFFNEDLEIYDDIFEDLNIDKNDFPMCMEYIEHTWADSFYRTSNAIHAMLIVATNEGLKKAPSSFSIVPHSFADYRWRITYAFLLDMQENFETHLFDEINQQLPGFFGDDFVVMLQQEMIKDTGKLNQFKKPISLIIDTIFASELNKIYKFMVKNEGFDRTGAVRHANYDATQIAYSSEVAYA